MSTEEYIVRTAAEVVDLLIQKNKDYGDTANNTTKIFSKLDAVEGICSRIDDKLSSIANKGINDKTEETELLKEYIIMEKEKLDEGRKTF